MCEIVIVLLCILAGFFYLTRKKDRSLRSKLTDSSTPPCFSSSIPNVHAQRMALTRRQRPNNFASEFSEETLSLESEKSSTGQLCGLVLRPSMVWDIIYKSIFGSCSSTAGRSMQTSAQHFAELAAVLDETDEMVSDETDLNLRLLGGCQAISMCLPVGCLYIYLVGANKFSH